MYVSCHLSILFHGVNIIEILIHSFLVGIWVVCCLVITHSALQNTLVLICWLAHVCFLLDVNLGLDLLDTQDRIMPLKDISILILFICGCVTLHGKNNFEDVTKLRILIWGNYPVQESSSSRGL